MKKLFAILGILAGVPMFQSTPDAYGWGFYAHKKINRMAVFTLPPSMIGFYKNHIVYLSAHAVDADRRRYSTKGEGARHFFDSEYYGLHPFDSVPHRWDQAVLKFTEDTLMAHGILPWQIERTMRRLCKAFREENLDLILHYSADLGHYVADAHVPLHTTHNYDGQFTNQLGIHAFWESRIPELKAESYDYLVGQASFIDNPLEAAWAAVRSSFQERDTVLGFEAQLNKVFPSDLKYSFETHGKKLERTYSEAYTNAYNELMGNLVERRMVESVRMLGCLWYTAWVDAGQPDLSCLLYCSLSDSLRQAQRKEEEHWSKQAVFFLPGHVE